MNKYFLSDEQLQVRDAVRRFAAERITPQARHIDESDTFPRALFDELAAQGWLGARVAPEFGGAGCDAVTACLILEEVSRASGSVGNSMNSTREESGEVPLMTRPASSSCRRYALLTS